MSNFQRETNKVFELNYLHYKGLSIDFKRAETVYNPKLFIERNYMNGIKTMS